jgi:hypothetical protein
MGETITPPVVAGVEPARPATTSQRRCGSGVVRTGVAVGRLDWRRVWHAKRLTPVERQEWRSASRERRQWLRLTLLAHFSLWLAALAWRPTGDPLVPAVLVAVVVFPLSWVLWVRTHPELPGPGYSLTRVRRTIGWVSAAVAAVAALLLLVVERS